MVPFRFDLSWIIFSFSSTLRLLEIAVPSIMDIIEIRFVNKIESKNIELL